MSETRKESNVIIALFTRGAKPRGMEGESRLLTEVRQER